MFFSYENRDGKRGAVFLVMNVRWLCLVDDVRNALLTPIFTGEKVSSDLRKENQLHPNEILITSQRILRPRS